MTVLDVDVILNVYNIIIIHFTYLISEWFYFNNIIKKGMRKFVVFAFSSMSAVFFYDKRNSSSTELTI